MVIDSSAVIAILFKEPEAALFETAVLDDPLRYMSAASWVESAIVLQRHSGDQIIGDLDRLIERMKIEIVPVTVEQAGVAREASHLFGKGRHKAGLNFGDCFSYALAKVSGEPLLCKGNDFGLTDLATVTLPG
ncbi:MAG: type II toxin-antitoxin system VapC family toxin [Bryobacteraceae bacterium]